MSRKKRSQMSFGSRGLYAFIVIIFLSVIAGGWGVGKSVIAYRSQKTIHIFPTEVQAVGWIGVEKARTQELDHDASLVSFSPENSAFVYLDAVAPSSLEESETATSTIPEDAPLNSDSADVDEMHEENIASSTDDVTEVRNDSDENPHEAIPNSQTEEIDVEATTTPPDVGSSTSGKYQSWVAILGSLAFAQENVEFQGAECNLLNVPCHTIEFSGFTLGEDLLEKELESVAINFSFASPQLTQAVADDMLVVRYFQNGVWRVAGELFINKDVSNEANGGYFVAHLEDVEHWEDVRDLRVMVEFSDASAETPAALYFDALWIDVKYSDRVAESFLGDDDVFDVPENITFTLKEPIDSGSERLTLSSGEVIDFPYLGLRGEGLQMRADSHAYYPTLGENGILRSKARFSITNTGDEPDSFRLLAAFPEGRGSIQRIAQYMHNVPTASTTESVREVSYFCESGWVNNGDEYTCEASAEVRACLSVSESGENCSSQTVVLDETIVYGSDWVPVEIAMIDDPREYETPGYIGTQITDTIDILSGQSIYLEMEISSPEPGPIRFALAALGNAYEGYLDSAALKDESAASQEEEVNEVIDAKHTFDADELPFFTFRFNTQRSIFDRLLNIVIGRPNTFDVERATLESDSGFVENVTATIEQGEDGEWSLRLKTIPRGYHPGKFTLTVAIKEGEEVYTDTVEFYWGVLAINSHKAVYAPGEVAQLSMAALTDAGSTICDAHLDLFITDPGGSATSVPVRESGECGPDNVVDVGDYLAEYTTGEAGIYSTTLTRIGPGGRVLHQIVDSFEVREVVPFSIERRGATRIYPIAQYTMQLAVTARDDFTGQFIEAVPEEFVIIDPGGAESEIFGKAKRLIWSVDLKAGETVNFEYVYDAPDVSPFLYLLGPAEIREGEGIPFVETRQWKIASDAVGNLLLYWDQSYIPTGWTCVSCAGGDAFYQRFIVGSSTPSLNGGATTHTHTATGIVNNASGGNAVNNTGGTSDIASITHTHTYSPIIDSPSNLPPYRNLVVIQANSTGEVQIPAGAIAIFDVASSSLPAGWFRYSAQDGRFTRGEATANSGATGGANTHTHAISGNTGNAVGGLNASGSGTSYAGPTHNHAISSTTEAVSNVPPYREALLARITATSTAPNGMIGMWTGDTFTGWDIVSGSSGAFENRFVLASTTYGGTGGGETHTHANVNNIDPGAASGAAVSRQNTGTSNGALSTHTHAVNVTNFSTVNHLPPYRTAVFAKRAGGASPAVNNLYTLFESEKTGTSTPRLEFSAVDSDDVSDLVFQVQWDDDADLDVSPIGDRTSDVETGCSPNCFENLATPSDTAPFNENERIGFTIQTSLVSGTTYYWRVRAKADGTSTWGSWATTTSFTYIGGTDPSQWFQTEDAQFETGTLIDTETFGSDAVRILAETPVEALVVYGEGTVQTPRYQIWDGSNWGGELSAQNVGGTIQWVITKAAPTRDEYVLGTQDAGADVNVQVYDGAADTWGDLLEVTAVLDDITARGFDIAYESQSGDAIVVYCDGDGDPSYHVWNGTSWVGPTTVTLSLANDCEYIKLASDPTSDEIILVARDTAASATDYEAIVWDGSAWGNSVTMGSMTDTLNEGIAVEYEESGNQAVVAVSNGDTNGFLWAAWDGVEWTVPTPQALGDDFEWGIMKRDVGSDAMALCYADQDDDLGVVRWDGGAWAATQEFELTANVAADNTVDGRPISCEFEITSGRDGYLMVPYSDTAAVRYQFMDDATGFSGEASLATINDSWTVGTTRTGDGTVLMVAWDDANTQYDFSFWDGSTWASDSTLEASPSVTAEPFREPVHLAAQIYQPAVGAITSLPVSFSSVTGQPTWGEVSWETTEPSGTDVILQVLDGSSGTCGAALTNGVLSGNESGFDATASPLDLSGISTTTYSALCLEATLSSASQNNPTLDEWGISWERQPYLTQTNYRWYANAASSLTPSDPWPQGATNLNENDTISASYAPVSGAILRLRMSVLTENVSLPAGALSLKLQYASGSTCDAGSAWFDVGAIGSTTAAWRGTNNVALSDGASIPSTVLVSSDVGATYEEENDSAVNPSSASINQETEWDWVLQHNASPGVNYCFRAVYDNGEPLNEYDRYPQVVTNQRPTAPALEKPFSNEQVASTSPWFEFAGEDPESNDITYQIQIDDDTNFDDAPLFDRNSQDHLDDFNNIITPADRDPFNSGQTIRFIPASALSSGTTYYWRVRGKDRNASNAWSDWSETYSVTIDTGTTITTWYQTTEEQFETDTHEDTEPSVSDAVVLSSGFTLGTTTSTSIDFDWKTNGNAWGELSWTDVETSSDIKYHIEYLNGSTWELIPETDLTGNAAGFDTSPISLLGVDPLTYNEIRLRANLTDAGASPQLLDWRLEWGFAVSQPTQSALFDNEKTGTTTPTFRFVSEDPDDDSLIYEISWSTTPDFTASTTRESSLHAGFANTASSTDTSPFVSGDIVRFSIQTGDALSNGTTYWWRVRARDPGGSDVWSVWSPVRSFTVDTSVTVSTWFQTTDEQFDTNELNDIETGSDSVQITSTIREAFVAYAEGTAQVPRYRIWNGASWSAEGSALSIGDTVRFVETDAAPTRDEYIIVTQGSTGVIDAQIFDGDAVTWGDSHEVENAVSDVTQRGFDVAYETDSGDAIAVACNGTEAAYSVWDGSSWTGPSAITLSVSGNCEWVRLASNPTSDEIIAVFRDATTGATDYEALVWSGSSWGNSTTTGSQVAANNEGIALEYEESGGQAVVAISNGAGNSFRWLAWNGSSWANGGAVAIGNDFANGRMCRDVGSDALGLVYIDIDSDIGYARWDGSAWSASTEFDIAGNAQNGRPVTCEYETNGARDSYLMIPYSDTVAARYQFWDNSILSGEATITTITDAWEMRSTRTGDGNILVVAYDDANTEYDFSYWNGTSWSTEEVLETNSIPTLTPATIPIDIVARRYPAFTSGSVVSDGIDFDEGQGLKWDEVSWSKTTPGASTIAVQVQYATSTNEWAPIPDSVVPGNSSGTTTSPIDLGNANFQTYNTLRLVADFQCVAGDCPSMSDWTLTWSPGLEISGTAKQYDQSTNVTSGTVAVAVNGSLQSGKTAAISGGTWTISNVTVFPGDIVTVFIDGASEADRAVAVTSYDGTGDISGVELFSRHLSIGSNDNPTISNANLALFDSTSEADVFHDVDAGNDLAVCAVAGCSDAELWIRSGSTFRPDSTSSGNVAVHDIEVNGTFVGDGNTFTLTGSWDNNAVFTANTSTVVFAATSTTESIDSTGASSVTFNNVTFGTSGSATWTLATPLDVNGNLAVNFGTLSKGAHALTIAGNLAIGASGIWEKGSGTTTFDGSSTATWSDASVSKQDIGKVEINGAAKTVQLGSNVKATDITIGSDDTLSASGSNYGLEVEGNWTNNNSFSAQLGTVTFTATTTGRTITPGNSPFYNLTFNGVGGNWAFTSGVSATNDFTIATGTVTLSTGTTTVGGNFTSTNGTFMHNNGVVLFNTSSSKSIQPGVHSFYDLTFNGSGSWNFPAGAATSSRHTLIQAGTVTLPAGTFAVGGSFTKSGGSFVHNSGTLRFFASNAQTIRLNNSDAHNLTFDGAGSWSFIDTHATTTNTVRIDSGTLTLPSGTLAVGGSWQNTSTFTHNGGTVRFNSSDTGETIAPGGSWFSTLIFDSAGGGWTITENATSSATTTLSRASAFTLSSGRTLAIGGAFVNSVGGATTTWTGSALYLYAGTRYSVNTKTGGSDSYGSLIIGANTDVSLWNSDASSYDVNSSGSLYSQDHAGVDGDLSIWGSYERASGNEYWSYATDFDGTALGGSSRQVDVRFASNASFRHAAGTFEMVGQSGATTTVANQGSGTYALQIAGGTLNAEYYSIRNTDVDGLYILGTPTITSLARGDFELGLTGGSMLSLASTVIDTNPALQIDDVRFATSSGVSSGFNVTATTSAASYWWFRDHYGAYASEAFDNDANGDPGQIRFDDSSFSITISGTVYSDRGVTPMGSPTCDNTTPVVRIVVNGGSPVSGSCDSSDGTFSIPGVLFTGDAVITAYLDGASERAVTVTRTPTADITGFDLYAKALIVRHESTGALGISHLALFDNSDDSDVFFAASSTLILSPENELHVWGGKTFTPGGNITLEGGGSGDSRDGRLHLASGAVFNASGSQTHRIGGDFVVTSGAVFNAASSSVLFTATTSKIISFTPPVTLWNVTFDGTGGSWNLAGATTTVQNSFTISNGTLGGVGNVIVESGTLSGNGGLAMTGGTVHVRNTGNLGGNTPWQFYNLQLGDGSSVRETTRVGTGTTTALGVVTVRSNHTLNAGSSVIEFAGSSTPFVVSGIFDVESAPVTYSSTGATNVADENYGLLTLSPSGAGTPTYTFLGGVFSVGDLVMGTANPVIVTANTNDPSITVTGDVYIASGSTLIASNVGAFEVGGSWSNLGVFTHSNGEIMFNSSDSGEVVAAGGSLFYDLEFNNASGGWTISEPATTTRHFSLLDAAAFTLASGQSLSVGGTFTNAVGGSATEWSGSTLSLRSGTSYSMNTKTTGGDVYGTLVVDSTTDVRMWHSSAVVTNVAQTSSLYSQDHANNDGDLYIWGEYQRSSGNDYWSYETDFDGTSLGSPRQVDVRIASSSSISLMGGVLDIIATSSATTTVAVQGSGAYSFAISGGTFNASYYQLRDLNAAGLAFSGSPTVASLSDGDFELAVNGGSLITLAGSVITANPLKIPLRVRFATSTAAVSGNNVTATGVTATSWKFNFHYGGLDGESYDVDPAGDPGYVLWDDSAAQITIAGNVYSDEGTTAAAICDGSTPQVRLRVAGVSAGFVACDDITGEYSIPNVSYNPGDSLIVYLDGTASRAANITVDPITTINNMHLYENRVILRHEDSAPITIADMAVYDSSDDVDIPFTAIDDTTDTLTVPPETKLIVWNSKTFAPAGNITLESGGSGAAWDGTLELLSGAQFSAAGTQTHSVGGSLILDASATLSSAQSTFVMTATTTGKTIQSASSSLYNLTFNGSGGNWAFSGPATTSNNFTITQGTITLPSGTLAVGGTFDNTGGVFMHNNGRVQFTATATGKTVRANGSNFYDLTFSGSGGAWSFSDTHATSSRDVTLSAGTVTLPSGFFAVGSSFIATSTGAFANGGGTVRLTAASAGKTVQGGSSSFNNVTFDGVGGEWIWNDASSNANNVTIVAGSTTLPRALSVSGSFENIGGSFFHNYGTTTFSATATGKNIRTNGSWFYSLSFNSSSGGWTILDSATATNAFSLSLASAFTQSPGTTLTVGGAFTNAVGGAATTWTGSTLILSGASSTINSKAQSGDLYNTLIVGANTDVNMWNSSAGTTTVDTTGSLHSKDHAGVDGDLYIWGSYERTSGTEYWSYATDFDGTALGGSSRQVDVRIASSSSLAFSGGTLSIVGSVANVSVIDVQGTGGYAFAVSGGTLNAQYYRFRNLDSDGLDLSGTPSITSLDNGDFELAVSGGSLMSVTNDVIDANAGLQISGVAFATSTGVSSGFNVKRIGSPVAAWNFIGHSGNYDGESYDDDGGDACGSIRWTDSACLFVSQEHYRWRNDDGAEGAPDSAWYDQDWSKRKRITIENPTATSYTNVEVAVDVTYDADMQVDFDDLRFTDESGTTSIDYWMETFTTSGTSTVWLEIPSLPANDQAVVYMYYGNASVLTTGDGEAVFDFFDDFEDDNISEYSGNTSLFNVGTDFNYSGTYGLDAFGNEDQKTNGGIYQTGSLIEQDTSIRYFQYVDVSAGNEDSPCALFGVQGSAQNYAVCLNLFETDKVFISENVISNESEGAGSVLASTTVSFVDTGWYEIVIDWLSDDSIDVTVFDPNGAEFATVSYTDSSYSTGGLGFTYWLQHGGWDFYSVRQYFATEPSYVFSVEQTDGGASWRAAEDTYTSINSATELETNLRLRFSIQNTGSNLSNQEFRLKFANKGASLSCEAVPYGNYSDVPVAGNCGSSAACMAATANFTNLSPTTELLSSPANLTFTTGSLVEDSSNTAATMNLNANRHTEIEYNLQMTSSAVANAYCFRVFESGADVDLDNYESVAELRLVHEPFITNWALNSGFDIALTEGATTTVSATGTVTDFNGYADIVSATSTVYRSGVAGGEYCTANENACYPISQCSFSECSGNSCTVTCTAEVQYHADPTDVGAVYESESWIAGVSVYDASGAFFVASSTGVDLLSLFGLSVTSAIDYGALYVGESSTTTAQTTVANTGNTNIDLELEGTNLGGIPVSEQAFATSTFVYASCSICQFLTGTGSPTGLEVDLPKPTSTSTPVVDEVYWGINIPDNTAAGSFGGTNTFWATAE